MTASKEKLGSNRVRVEVDVPAARFQDSINRVYRSSRGEFNIPGFRKGKAPRAVIESHYGPGIFYNKAFDDMFPEVYAQTLKELDVVPVGPPENLTFLEVDGTKGIRFSFEVYTLPEVVLGNYEGLAVTRRHHTITDAEIDDQLRSMQIEGTRFVETDEPAQNGDQLNMNFVGTLDGEVFDGGSADETTLVLGSGRFIPGFEEQLVGMRSGEDRDITVTFPEDYQSEGLAGRDVQFAVHVNSVSHGELPALDDEFAEDVSEFDTLAELRDDIRSKMQAQVDRELENALETELLGQIVADSTIDVPPVVIDNEVNDRLAGVRQQLVFQGISLEDYLQSAGTDVASYAAALRPEAEHAIRLRLVVPELVRALEAEPTPEELDAVYTSMAEERGEEPKAFKEKMSPVQKEAIASREGMQRMLSKLKELSEITEEELDLDKIDKDSAAGPAAE